MGIFTKYYKDTGIPDPDASGSFIPTLNNTGYMTTRLDPYSQEFVGYAAKKQGVVLDIGAAYGIASLEALKRGAKVISNDIEQKHLDILKKAVSEEEKSRLTVCAEKFPDELNFTDNYFDAVLISRVLHLFRGDTIEQSIKKIHHWLKPGGKLFIVAETPYSKIFEAFIPVYEARVKLGEEWPGLMENLQQFIAPEKTTHFPQFINLLDVEVLTKVLKKQNFKIEKASLIARYDFPPDRWLDGREGVGVVAFK